MEPLLEQEYTTGRRMLTEFYRKIALGPRPATTAVIAAVFALVCLYAVSAGIWEDIRGFYYCMLALEAVIFFLPNLTVWNILRTTRKRNDGQIPVTRVRLGEAAVQLLEGMVQITTPYSKICRVVKLKHSYVLMLDQRSGILLAPDGFTKGSLEECRALLQRKCPQLRIP